MANTPVIRITTAVNIFTEWGRCNSNVADVKNERKSAREKRKEDEIINAPLMVALTDKGIRPGSY